GDVQDLDEVRLQLAGVVGELAEAALLNEGLLDPQNLYLLGRDAGRLEPAVHSAPDGRIRLAVDALRVGPLFRRLAALSTVHDDKGGRFVGVAVGDLLEDRELLGRVRHTNRQQNDLAVGRRFAVRVEWLNLHRLPRGRGPVRLGRLVAAVAVEPAAL